MAVTRKELLGGGTIAGVVALGIAPVAQAHGGDQDIVGSWNGTITATDPPLGSFGNLSRRYARRRWAPSVVHTDRSVAFPQRGRLVNAADRLHRGDRRQPVVNPRLRAGCTGSGGRPAPARWT